MTLDEYCEEIDRITENCLSSGQTPQNAIASHEDLTALAHVRTELMSDSDVLGCYGFLATGFFANEPKLQRLALFRICLDIEIELSRKCVKARCSSYIGSPLVDALPQVEQYVVKDLVGAQGVQQLNSSDVVRVDGGFARIDSSLGPRLFEWAVSNFSKEKFRVRLDPRFGSAEALVPKLCEYVLHPPNPTWWKSLGLRKGETDACSFALDPETAAIKHREQAHWEFSAKGVRRLEVFVKKENQGRMSMMLEEVSVREERSGYIIGRCIHLDTESEVGTPFEEAQLKHIDLAINVYEGDRLEQRLANSLCDHGRVVDASYRTHLLRIDEAGFPILFDLATGFFDSQCLTQEWMSAQFPIDKAE